MSSNSIAIRNAIFQRIAPLTPAGAAAWGLARTVSAPIINATMFPALQVVLLKENYTPDGDGNVGPPRFIVDATVGMSVMRGMADPAVLDGSADTDLVNFLDTLLHDGTFVNSDSGSSGSVFGFESIERIETDRRMVQMPAEAYMLELVLRMTFRTREYWDALAPNMLTTVSISLPLNTLVGEQPQQGGSVYYPTEIDLPPPPTPGPPNDSSSSSSSSGSKG